MRNVLFIFISWVLINSAAMAQTDCSTARVWNSTTVFWANDQVSYNGGLYKAKWYTQSQIPGDPYGPWAYTGTCNNSNGTTTGCSGLSSWNAASPYVQGTEVIYAGKKFKAKWWTQNQTPGDLNGPWEDLGICNTPVINSSSSFQSFSTSVGTPSADQIITLNGSNLSGVISITAPANFEVSLIPGSAYSTGLILNPGNGSVPTTKIYVRYNPNGTGTHNGTILITSANVNTILIPVSGTSSQFTYTVCNDINVWSPISIYIEENEVSYNGKRFKARWWNQNQAPVEDPYGAWAIMSTCIYSSFNFTGTIVSFTTLLGTPTAPQQFVLNGSNLIAPVSVNAPSGFELSVDNNAFYSSLSISPLQGSIVNKVVYVRYNPFYAGLHSGNILLMTTGLPPQTIAISGTSGAPWILKGNLIYNNPSLTRVGIGTDNVPSTYLLGVNGKIISKGLKVQFEGWADEVFDEKYNLLSLDSLSSYVKEHKHLPEFPSEKEVLTNGMAIEDMNVLLLKKIEEMTLLLIEQDKRVKELEKKIEEVRK